MCFCRDPRCQHSHSHDRAEFGGWWLLGLQSLPSHCGDLVGPVLHLCRESCRAARSELLMPLEHPKECMQKLSEAGLTDVRYIVALTQNERPATNAIIAVAWLFPQLRQLLGSLPNRSSGVG